MTDCVGFQGRYWVAGTIVDIDPSQNPPRFFVPLETVVEQQKVVHRTEPIEMTPGKNREVVGGLAHDLNKTVLPRILTTDKLPNNVEPIIKKKRLGRPRKNPIAE